MIDNRRSNVKPPDVAVAAKTAQTRPEEAA
jgi:hypothetical protein